MGSTYLSETKHCEIWCVDYTGGEASDFGALPDGTPCSYDKPYDICFQVIIYYIFHCKINFQRKHFAFY